MDLFRPFFAVAVSFFLFTASLSPIIAQDQPAGDDAAEIDPAEAQKQFMEYIEEFGWQRDGTGDLKSEAAIDIPNGFRFTGPKGAAQLMETYGNPATDREYGLIGPEDLSWCVLFEFDKSGYVKDDEKDSIDAPKLMKSMMSNQDAANRYRKQEGLEEIFITGWTREPFYNDQTNNLEWAIRLKDNYGGETVNFNTRLLGRNGVMEAVLICEPDQLDTVLPVYQNLIGEYRYKAGNTYAEYKSGDKIAKYGLTALIVGGGAAVAAKTGLLAWIAMIFAKGGKAVWLGVVAVFAGIWSGIKRLFGRGD